SRLSSIRHGPSRGGDRIAPTGHRDRSGQRRRAPSARLAPVRESGAHGRGGRGIAARRQDSTRLLREFLPPGDRSLPCWALPRSRRRLSARHGAAAAARRCVHESGRCVSHAWRRLDRKSTRLNSSHDQISYAVFCLKKKKKKKNNKQKKKKNKKKKKTKH